MLGSFIRHGLTQEEAESDDSSDVSQSQIYPKACDNHCIDTCTNITHFPSATGSDTTATAVQTTFLYLITNPRVLSKLRAEIAAASASVPITDAEARKLPYLQAVIKEGLRIWPPVVGHGERSPTWRRRD
jgi:hypothetical protein